MMEHQERVVKEQADLEQKVSALSKFLGTSIYAGLERSEQERLAKQLRYMRLYNGVLNERIEAFE